MDEALLVSEIEKTYHVVNEAFHFIYDYGLKILKSNNSLIMLYYACCSSFLLLVILARWCFIKFKLSSQILIAEQKPTNYVLVFGGQKSGKTATLESIAKKKITSLFPLCPNLNYAYRDIFWFLRIVAAKWKNVPHLRSDPMEDIQTLSYNLAIMKNYLRNFHVLIFCVPFHKILTNDSEEYFNTLKSVWEPSILKHVIVAFTHCDDFVESKIVNFSKFEEWLHSSAPRTLKDVLRECNNRYIFLKNKTASGTIKAEQSQDSNIVSMCMDIVNVKESPCLVHDTAIFQNQLGLYLQSLQADVSDPLWTVEPSRQENMEKSIINSENDTYHDKYGSCYEQSVQRTLLRTPPQVAEQTLPRTTNAGCVPLCAEEEREEGRREEEGDDRKGPLPSIIIKDMLKKWEEVQKAIIDWHPNKTEVNIMADLFNEKAVHHFRVLLKKRERQVTLDKFFQPVPAKNPRLAGAEEQAGPSNQQQATEGHGIPARQPNVGVGKFQL